jgi:hypothetical protein
MTRRDLYQLRGLEFRAEIEPLDYDGTATEGMDALDLAEFNEAVSAGIMRVLAANGYGEAQIAVTSRVRRLVK